MHPEPRLRSPRRGSSHVGSSLQNTVGPLGGYGLKYRARSRFQKRTHWASTREARANLSYKPFLNRLLSALGIADRTSSSSMWRLTAESAATCRSPSAAVRGKRIPFNSAFTKASLRSHRGARFVRFMISPRREMSRSPLLFSPSQRGRAALRWGNSSAPKPTVVFLPTRSPLAAEQAGQEGETEDGRETTQH